MKYFLTYCVMDSRLANPMWHACLLASTWDESDQPVEVKGAWGFYAAPISQPNSIRGMIKKFLGIPFDLQGNYGVLKKEELRFLDLGYGLYGVSFAITSVQYDKLQDRCHQIISAQSAALQEMKTRVAKEDQTNSYALYQAELADACLQARIPRLKPFNIQLSLDEYGDISVENSFTCKTMAIELLKYIELDAASLALITLNHTSTAMPRWCGEEMKPLFFKSEGPQLTHRSNRTGKITFFRSFEEPNTRLYWVEPPQVASLVEPTKFPALSG